MMRSAWERLLADGVALISSPSIFRAETPEGFGAGGGKVLEKDAGICFYMCIALLGVRCLKSEDGAWLLASWQAVFRV
jgi:hypothetical protein